VMTTDTDGGARVEAVPSITARPTNLSLFFIFELESNEAAGRRTRDDGSLQGRDEGL